MKEKFNVTGMTCIPHSTLCAAGRPVYFNLRGQNEFALAPRFCLKRQNACTRLSARTLSRVAEQAMPMEVLP